MPIYLYSFLYSIFITTRVDVEANEMNCVIQYADHLAMHLAIHFDIYIMIYIILYIGTCNPLQTTLQSMGCIHTIHCIGNIYNRYSHENASIESILQLTVYSNI